MNKFSILLGGNTYSVTVYADEWVDHVTKIQFTTARGVVVAEFWAFEVNSIFLWHNNETIKQYPFEEIPDA